MAIHVESTKSVSKSIGVVIGFILSYAIFTTILYFVVNFVKGPVQPLTIVGITLAVVIISRIIKKVLA